MPENLWSNIQGTVQKSLSAGAYASWIAPLGFDKIDSCTLHLNSPSRFAADLVKRDFLSNLLDAAQSVNPEISEIKIGIQDVAPIAVVEAAPAEQLSLIEPAVVASIEQFGIRLSAKYEFSNFYESPSNAFALAAVRQILASPCAYNPLVIHSTSGQGKTHLLQSFAKSSKSPLYISADRFIYDYVKAIRENNWVAVKSAILSHDSLVIDDIQNLAGKEGSSREISNIVSEFIANGKQVLISANDSPYKIDGLDAALKSKLSAGLSVEIMPADLSLRKSIIQNHTSNVPLSAEVSDFIASKITTSVRDIESAMTKISAGFVLMNEVPTVEIARRALSDLLSAASTAVSIDKIKKTVAARFGVSLSSLDSEKKSREIAKPRMIAMFLAKRLTNKSLPQIGAAFGGRNHATVIHACKKIDAEILANSKLSAIVDDLEHACL